MTTPQLTLSAPRGAETRVIASVSAAHFVSHFYFLVLPPLFVFVRDEYGLSYTELALAITVFNIVSAIFQTPAGLLADRIGAFTVLVAGLVLGAIAFALTGLVHSYWFLVAMFGIAGLANTVYHPADYALLVAPRRGRAHGQRVFNSHFRRHAGRRRRPGHYPVRTNVGRLARCVHRGGDRGPCGRCRPDAVAG